LKSPIYVSQKVIPLGKLGHGSPLTFHHNAKQFLQQLFNFLNAKTADTSWQDAVLFCI